MDIKYNANDILEFSYKRDITLLFKDFLATLEELQNEHNEALTKLVSTLPVEHRKQIYLANHFTPEKMNRLRKDVLDKGNDAIRNFESQLKMYEISLKVVKTIDKV